MSIDDDIRSAFADHDDEMAGRAASWPAIESGIRRRVRRAAVVAPAVVVASIALLSLGAWNLVSRDTFQIITPAETSDTGFLILRQDGALELRDASGKLEREVLPADESMGYRYKLSVSRATGMAYFAVLNDAEDCGDRMFSVDIATSELREIGRGRAPAVSPDGRWLAYGSFTGSGSSAAPGSTCRTQGLRIDDLQTGQSTVWPTGSWSGASDPTLRLIPSLISWATDSEHLGYVVAEDHMEDQGRPAVFMTTRVTAGSMFTGPVPLPPSVRAIEFIRMVDADTARIVVVDASPGRRQYEIDPREASPAFDIRGHPVSGYDIDARGRWVLIASPNETSGLSGRVEKWSRERGAEYAIDLHAAGGSFGEVVWYD